jgi:hypothetical protein
MPSAGLGDLVCAYELPTRSRIKAGKIRFMVLLLKTNQIRGTAETIFDTGK